MRFDAKYNDRFRDVTARAKNEGITLPYHTCSRCGKRAAKMKKVAGTGTSRYNPITWICLSCLEA